MVFYLVLKRWRNSVTLIMQGENLNVKGTQLLFQALLKGRYKAEATAVCSRLVTTTHNGILIWKQLLNPSDM
jgi:hypothetical protein